MIGNFSFIFLFINTWNTLFLHDEQKKKNQICPQWSSDIYVVDFYLRSISFVFFFNHVWQKYLLNYQYIYIYIIS